MELNKIMKANYAVNKRKCRFTRNFKVVVNFNRNQIMNKKESQARKSLALLGEQNNTIINLITMFQFKCYFILHRQDYI